MEKKEIIEKVLKEIKEELESGVKRNKVLPLDWAMDRITPIIQKALQMRDADLQGKIENFDWFKIVDEKWEDTLIRFKQEISKILENQKKEKN